MTKRLFSWQDLKKLEFEKKILVNVSFFKSQFFYFSGAVESIFEFSRIFFYSVGDIISLSSAKFTFCVKKSTFYKSEY